MHKSLENDIDGNIVVRLKVFSRNILLKMFSHIVFFSHIHFAGLQKMEYFPASCFLVILCAKTVFAPVRNIFWSKKLIYTYIGWGVTGTIIKKVSINRKAR